MADDFGNQEPGITGPAAHAYAITPNDAQDLAKVTRGLLLSTTGNVKVTMLGGDTVTLPLAGNVFHPLRVARVWATGLTAGLSVFGCH